MDNLKEETDLGQDPVSKEVKVPETKVASQGISVEKEHVLFARVLDFKQFAKATKCEKIEQWSVNVPRTEENAAEGSIRIRKTTDIKGESKHIMAVKIRKGDVKFENETITNEGMFAQMKFLATGGMIKDRYTFETNEGNWECDLVPDGKGGYYNWIRIELEVDDLSKPLPALPIQTEEVILPKGMEQTLSEEERKAKVDQLYSTIFVVKNSYLEEVAIKEQIEEVEEPNQGAEVVESSEETEPQTEDNTEEVPESQEETEVTADDITTDPDKAEQTEEKAEEVEKEKEEEEQEDDSDEDSQDVDETESNEESDEASEEKALNQATEALRELTSCYYEIKEKHAFTSSERVYYDSVIAHARNKAGIPAMNAALEDLVQPSDEVFKLVALEGIVDSVTNIIKAFGTWMGHTGRATRDFFRAIVGNTNAVYKRSEERYKLLVRGKLIAEEGRVVNVPGVSLIAIDGTFTSLNDVVNQTSDLVLNYVKNFDREQTYQDLSNILRDAAFISKDATNFELWSRVLKTNMVPSKGFFLAEKNATHEVWAKHVAGNKIYAYQKPIVFFPGKNDFHFEVKPVTPSHISPQEITVSSQSEYEALFEQIMKITREIKVEVEQRERLVKMLQGPIFDTIESLSHIDETTGEKVYKEINKHSDAVVEMGKLLVTFIDDELSKPIEHLVNTLNNTINISDKLLTKK